MSRRPRVLFVASECVPFVKTGGLADVAGALPVALARQGLEVSVVLPKYRAIDGAYTQRMEHVWDAMLHLGWRTQYAGLERLRLGNVTYYFVDNEFYFGASGVYSDGEWEVERFSFFCKAVVELLPHMGEPELLHLNDWQTGMILPLLRARGNPLPALFTIHNLGYQGVTSIQWLNSLLELPGDYFTMDKLEFYGGASFMKGGLVFANRITTVSPNYAREILTPERGERLDGVLRSRAGDLEGVLNGIDTRAYDPGRDPWLAAPYGVGDLAGKARCRAALQAEMGLAGGESPLIGIVSRLTGQKGFDLVRDALDDMMADGVQLAVLGSGEPQYEEFFRWACGRYPGQVGLWIGYNEGLAHRVYAGSDMLLMPSLFEPCGLAQMIAMRYGAIPIVRETGGLIDTVQPYNEVTGAGNGFTFARCDGGDLLGAVRRACGWRGNGAAWRALMERDMALDFGWDRAARRYQELYEGMLNADG